jgi:amidase
VDLTLAFPIAAGRRESRLERRVEEKRHMNPFASALDLARSIREKELSPLEIVDFYLARIDALNPQLNAVTWRRDDALRAEAKAAEAALMRGEARGPFFGVPIAIKDLTFVEGWPITFGSRSAEHNVTSFTATVVQRYIEAGFLLECRTNSPEFGIMPVAENRLWGATRNPWDLARTPGGSSGGSAAAVAAGMAPIAHANDGGGSIRIPAACCGLVGLKPSRGRVSSGPLVSDVMHGGAVEGCVSHTVADTAAVLDVLSAPDPSAWYNAPAPERPFAQEVGAKPGGCASRSRPRRPPACRSHNRASTPSATLQPCSPISATKSSRALRRGPIKTKCSRCS